MLTGVAAGVTPSQYLFVYMCKALKKEKNIQPGSSDKTQGDIRCSFLYSSEIKSSENTVCVCVCVCVCESCVRSASQ